MGHYLYGIPFGVGARKESSELRGRRGWVKKACEKVCGEGVTEEIRFQKEDQDCLAFSCHQKTGLKTQAKLRSGPPLKEEAVKEAENTTEELRSPPQPFCQQRP